jgi:hypothetical protein
MSPGREGDLPRGVRLGHRIPPTESVVLHIRPTSNVGWNTESHRLRSVVLHTRPTSNVGWDTESHRLSRWSFIPDLLGVWLRHRIPPTGVGGTSYPAYLERRLGQRIPPTESVVLQTWPTSGLGWDRESHRLESVVLHTRPTSNVGCDTESHRLSRWYVIPGQPRTYVGTQYHTD